MKVEKVLQDGGLFPAAVLDISTEDIISKFKSAAMTQAALSLGAGYATQLSAPHTILNGFKNLVAVSKASGFEFKEAQAYLSAAANAPAAAAAGPAAAKVEEKPAEEEKKEETEDVDMGNLFGGDDEYGY